MKIKTKNLKNNKGITLIALVITIIVMLILVTVTIRVATNGNLFTHAANAVKGTKGAQVGENTILNDELDKSIEDIVAEQTGNSGNVTNNHTDNWEKAWTYSASTNEWSVETTDYSEELTGDIVAKAYEVEGGYHLVIEKIGSSGEMGNTYYASNNNATKIADYSLYVNDSKTLMAKIPIVPGPLRTPEEHAWRKDINFEQIVKLSICNGITRIGDGAFDGCSNLKTVEVSDTVGVIGRFAFAGCSNLKKIAIPNKVTEIGEQAFAKCSSLTDVIIPGSVENIGDKLFSDCTKLVTVQILSDNIEEMNGTFSGCTSLTTVSHLPNTLTWMVRTFCGCTNLTESPSIPDNVTNMASAFHGCTKLSTVPTIPNGVESLMLAFCGCTSLSEVPELWLRVEGGNPYEGIPDGNGCFEGCTGASNYSEIPSHWKFFSDDVVKI